LTFVVLSGMILLIVVTERKERNLWPWGPWDPEQPHKRGPWQVDDRPVKSSPVAAGAMEGVAGGKNQGVAESLTQRKNRDPATQGVVSQLTGSVTKKNPRSKCVYPSRAGRAAQLAW
jgi:hypothetical protein